MHAHSSLPSAPTLEVFPGDQLVVTLKNSLGANTHVVGPGHLRGATVGTVDCTTTNCVTIPELENQSLTYTNPNSTNMHTHGLHIDSHEPGDNVIDVEINPGESYTYTYHLPMNHMPGTFWYHPHLHGSTTIQTGGGVAGFIIVHAPERNKRGYPPWLQNMTGGPFDQQVRSRLYLSTFLPFYLSTLPIPVSLSPLTLSLSPLTLPSSLTISLS
jgi:FtsP/CotA-like multicopper oxidase with cupredoxin domain